MLLSAARNFLRARLESQVLNYFCDMNIRCLGQKKGTDDVAEGFWQNPIASEVYVCVFIFFL